MRRSLDLPGQATSLPIAMAVETSGRLLFISGQGPIDPGTGEFVVKSFEQQARLTLDNLSAVAEAAGGTLGATVKVNAYLRDMADFPSFNELFGEYFPAPRPARTTIPAPLDGFDIEIDAVIALDP